MGLIQDTLKSTFKELEEVLKSRGKEYESKGEFGTFIAASKGTEIETVSGIMYMIHLKLARLKSAIANNSPVDDSILDLIGYAVILKAYLSIEKEPVPPAPLYEYTTIKGKRYRCPIDLINDNYDHLGDNFKCLRCNTTYSSRASFESHLCPTIWEEVK